MTNAVNSVESVHADVLVRCRLCGRIMCLRKGAKSQPHKCFGGYRKRFGGASRARGWESCFEPIDTKQYQGSYSSQFRLCHKLKLALVRPDRCFECGKLPGICTSAHCKEVHGL